MSLATPIPTRLAANEKHEWFDPFWSRRVRVLLAGEPVTGVVLADTIEGWVELYPKPYRRDPAQPDKLLTIRCKGEVRFLPPLENT
ncbi:MAG: hypothetical protein ACRYG8_01055 [Janthinobacterium lividum]